MLSKHMFKGNFISQSKKLASVRCLTNSSSASQQVAVKQRIEENGYEDVPMPHCDFQPEPFTGTDYASAMEKKKKYLSPGLLNYYREPLHIHQGHKQWLFDTDGKRYLDMFAGIVTVGVGHCHPKIEDAAFTQMRKLWHTTNIYLHPGIADYAEKLVSKLPGDLKVAYFVNSGTEANDMAMMLMRMYTGNWDIICHRNSYHGTGPTTLGVTSQSNWKYQIPHMYGTHPSANPDPYRGYVAGNKCRDSPIQSTRDCACGPGECVAGDYYVSQIQEVLDYNCPKKIAGLIAEPIQGVGGTVQYPKNYLARAYEKVREHGGICVADEVQTGFGRLGSHFWGFEAAGVMPDIVTMAKSIGNGFPMAAVVTTPAIAAKMKDAITFNTFGGNPMACAVGSAVLDVIDEENLQENCDVVGTHFLEGLAKLRDEFDIVGDVRGKGLMIGVEMVTDKTSRTPMPGDRMMDMWERTKEKGVLFGKGGYFGNVFRIKPPMCVTKEDADFAVSVLRSSIAEHIISHHTE